MFRRVLFALAGVALAALLAADRSPKAAAAAPELAGNWQLSTVTAAGESAVCILKVETKDGKPTATVVFSPANVRTTVTGVRATDTAVAVSVKQVRTAGKQQVASDVAFVGVRGADAKVILGSTGTATARTRAKLTATDKTELTGDELLVRTPLPEPMTKAQELIADMNKVQGRLFQEKDVEKRKEIQKEAAAARKELDERLPDLYREAARKHADSPAAFDAAVNLLTAFPRLKLAPDEAAELVAVAQKHAAPYGPQFAGVSMARVAEALAARPGLEAAALAAVEAPAKALTADDPAALRAAVLAAYRTALEKTGKTAEAKVVATELVALEAKVDAEYLRTVPPFKPAAFAGRKDKSANRVAVMELFTGAQCPPCVAADVAFDALLKSYKPADVVLIQYHLHIPGPDPLTNADAVARAKYYDASSTPSTFFNGKAAAGGGGGMANAESKYAQYVGVIDPLLEQTTEVKVGGRATRAGDKIDVAVEVTGADGDELKLRLLVVEEDVKYVGGNQLRFHHQVVRAMPLGADGVAITDKAFKQTAAVELGAVRKTLTGYLDDFAKARPFPKPERPMDLKALRVIALVQNDKTKEIVQAVQLEVEGKGTGGE